MTNRTRNVSTPDHPVTKNGGVTVRPPFAILNGTREMTETEMPRKLSLMVTWQFDMKKEEAIALAKIADECGIDSFWVPEGWARDPFSLLISIAEKTNRIKLATGIVNVYSRTPGALAQHFHGFPFQPSLPPAGLDWLPSPSALGEGSGVRARCPATKANLLK